LFAATLAAFFFALNATCASRSVQASGPVRANLGRLVISVCVLGLFAHTLGHGFGSASTSWFLLSGIIGLGLGDLGVFAALPLLGSRLTVLMTQCLAAPLAAFGEWLWLGTRLSGTQVLWGAVIIGGVMLALMPSKANPPRVRVRPVGFLFGLLAAAGQGFGALVSRKGVDVAIAAGESAHNATFGLNATYHRVLAGLVFTALWFLVLRQLGRLPPRPATPDDPAGRRQARQWLLANSLIGPVFAVGCYQWALATTPSGLVLPVVATTPLIAIPLAFWLEGERPSKRSVAGGVVAVAGAVALTLS